jgi:hypothetical protein
MELVAKLDQSTDVALLSDEELLGELASSLEITSRHLVRLAAVWVELERRGVDLSKLRSGLREWLPMIASGKLAAEVIVQYAGQGTLIRALAELPLQRQRDIARGEEIVVVTFARGAGLASEKVPAHRLSPLDVSLVFDKGHIRSADEQVPLLQDRARRRQKRGPVIVNLRLSASEYQALSGAAKNKKMHAATLVMDTLRAQGLLGR